MADRIASLELSQKSQVDSMAAAHDQQLKDLAAMFGDRLNEFKETMQGDFEAHRAAVKQHLSDISSGFKQELIDIQQTFNQGCHGGTPILGQ